MLRRAPDLEIATMVLFISETEVAEHQVLIPLKQVILHPRGYPDGPILAHGLLGFEIRFR